MTITAATAVGGGCTSWLGNFGTTGNVTFTNGGGGGGSNVSAHKTADSPWDRARDCTRSARPDSFSMDAAPSRTACRGGRAQ